VTRVLQYSDVYVSDTDEGALGVDLRTGKYFALDPRSLSKRTAGATISSTDNMYALGTALATHGLIPSMSVDSTPTQARVIDVQTHDSNYRPSAVASVRISWLHFLRFVTSGPARVRGHRQLYKLITQIRDRKASLGAISWAADSQVFELASVFFRIRAFLYTSHDNCLMDSIRLTLFLLKHKIPAILILGVQTRPFQAHAWVQFETVVLNDLLENVQRFAPVAAI
jgi:hypothetical protein